LKDKTLIIGATGFIGSNLLKKYEDLKLPIRVLARNTKKVIKKNDSTEVVYGDLDIKETIEEALDGVKTIYYFAHALNEQTDNLVQREVTQAQNLVKHITSKHRVIYLGGILPEGVLSDHLNARKSVGEVLKNSKAQTIEFRASIIIGDGSASFEIVRSIVNKLPIIITAKWSQSKCQPIALENVLEYLIAASNFKMKAKNSHYDIGGADIITYDELLTSYAKYKELYRPAFYISELPKELALKVLEFVSPEHFEVGSKLLESIEHETILNDTNAFDEFGIEVLNIQESLKLLNDDLVSQVEIGEFFKTGLGKELPEYLLGDSIQIFIPILNNNLEQFITEKFSNIEILKNMAEKFLATKSYEFKIPKTGEFKFTYNEAKSGIHLIVKPEFFFQSLGFTFLKKLLN
jgi:uncharacterized protein YbjT (DUF2867 family)